MSSILPVALSSVLPTTHGRLYLFTAAFFLLIAVRQTAKAAQPFTILVRAFAAITLCVLAIAAALTLVVAVAIDGGPA